MTTSAKDLSNYDGEPVILYDFYRRSTPTLTGVMVETHWRYTSADRDFTVGGNTYKAVPASDDGIRQGGGTQAEQLTIILPYDEAVPQMFVGSPPSDPIRCDIRQGNLGETDTFLAWRGIVGGVSRQASNADSVSIGASVLCNTTGATMDRMGLRLAWTRLCPHDLYGRSGCKVNPINFYLTGVITALTGNSVTASEFAAMVPAIQFAGGFIEWIDADGHADRLGIISVDGGSTLTLMGTTDRLTVGGTIYAFMGCDHTRFTCSVVFDNIDNHGGVAYMPETSPFSGDLIF